MGNIQSIAVDGSTNRLFVCTTRPSRAVLATACGSCSWAELYVSGAPSALRSRSAYRRCQLLGHRVSEGHDCREQPFPGPPTGHRTAELDGVEREPLGGLICTRGERSAGHT